MKLGTLLLSILLLCLCKTTHTMDKSMDVQNGEARNTTLATHTRKRIERNLWIARENFIQLAKKRDDMRAKLEQSVLSDSFMRGTNTILAQNFDIHFDVVAEKAPSPTAQNAILQAERMQQEILKQTSLPQKTIMEQIITFDAGLIRFHLAWRMLENQLK